MCFELRSGYSVKPDKPFVSRQAIPPLFVSYLDLGAFSKSLAGLGQLTIKRAETYLFEAAFFYPRVRSFFQHFGNSGPVLEVGGGIGALSLLLSSQFGVRTHVIEPESAGFEEMKIIREALLEAWTQEHSVSFFEGRIEDFIGEEEAPAFTFSINVMEHVRNYPELVKNLMNLSAPEAYSYHVFPNYSFPYEPHFDIPVVFGKPGTYLLFKRKILGHRSMMNPQGIWDDLSWPTTKRFEKTIVNMGFSVRILRGINFLYLSRLNESSFSQRKPHYFRILQKLVSLAGLALRNLPTKLLPVAEIILSRTRYRCTCPVCK